MCGISRRRLGLAVASSVWPGHQAVASPGELAIPDKRVTKGVRAAETDILRYDVVSLGVLDGYDYSKPTAINSHGTVVGVSSMLSYPDWCAFIWQHGVTTRLGNHPDSESCLGGAGAINDQGEVVGGSQGFESPSTAFRWHENKTIDLGRLPGHVTATAEDINQAGQIIGHSSAPMYFTREADLPAQGIIWEDGQIRELTPAIEGVEVRPRAISDDGQIVGNAWFSEQGIERAIFWTGNDITEIQPLAGDDACSAVGVNSSGAIVGQSYVANIPFPQTRGFLFTLTDRSMNELIGIEGAYRTVPTGINESGWIVGTSGFRGDTVGVADEMRAVLWRDGDVADLNSLIPSDSGWDLIEATAINDQGWIVGIGSTEGRIIPYDQRAFLLIPSVSG
jgi:probable HAF family extracellular repeat protein